MTRRTTGRAGSSPTGSRKFSQPNNRKEGAKMICTLFLKSRQEKGQTWTNTVYRGDMYALYRMADAQHAAVLFAAVHRELPQAFDRGGRTQAPSAQPSGGSGCKECADRTKPASGGAHYE